MKQLKLNVKGMHCKSCELLIREALEDAGAKNVKVSHLDGELSLESDLPVPKIKSLIKDEGYEVE